MILKAGIKPRHFPGRGGKIILPGIGPSAQDYIAKR
jgi:hypothetical protein